MCLITEQKRRCQILENANAVPRELLNQWLRVIQPQQFSRFALANCMPKRVSKDGMVNTGPDDSWSHVLRLVHEIEYAIDCFIDLNSFSNCTAGIV